jgi:endoglucanase
MCRVSAVNNVNQPRVNQLGYLTAASKGATVEHPSSVPVDWQLRDVASGKTVAAGVTRPRGIDPTAGVNVHTIDFTAAQPQPGTYQLICDGISSPAFCVADSLYAPLLHDSLVVFTLQRSGFEITADVAGPRYARAAGHLGVAPNQGDTAVSPLPAGEATTTDGVDLYNGWPSQNPHYVVDARGGWYDAGDAGKYVVNGGISVAGLLGLVERARRHGVTLPDETLTLDEARWELDWMLRMQVAPGLPFAGMVHHKVSDEHWTSIPTLPAEDIEPRYIHRPSTAATLNLAAVAAQGARVFADDPAYAAQLLDAARTAYAAAQATPDLLAPDTNVLPNPGSGPYDDAEIDDEFYWAAAELFLTTGEQVFLDDLRANPYHLDGSKSPWSPVGFDWRDVAAWVRMQLATVTAPAVANAASLTEIDQLRAHLTAQADTLIANDEPFGQLYTPDNHHYAWGSNGMVANNAAIVAAAFEVSGDTRYRDAALAGLDYLLGRNALGISYVVGYGHPDTHVRHQHSRWFARAVDPTLPHAPNGTLSGGPNSDCPDPISEKLKGLPAQLCFEDHIMAFGVNEMTINWNAALAYVAAFAATV